MSWGPPISSTQPSTLLLMVSCPLGIGVHPADLAAPVYPLHRGRYDLRSLFFETDHKEQSVMIAVSFDSCGWMYVFHFGVCKYLQDHFDTSQMQFAGASAGSLVACLLSAGLPTKDAVELVLSYVDPCGSNPFAMLGAMEEAFQQLAPDDCFRRCSETLTVALTQVSSQTGVKPVYVSTFHSNAYLLDVVRASCHIPVFGGFFPRYVEWNGQGGWFYDGGISDPMPRIANTTCIRVSAVGRSGADISNPVPPPSSWSLVPPSKEAMEHLYHLGYQAAHAFFEKRSIPEMEALRREDTLHQRYDITSLHLDGVHDKVRVLASKHRTRQRRWIRHLLYICLLCSIVYHRRRLITLLFHVSTKLRSLSWSRSFVKMCC